MIPTVHNLALLVLIFSISSVLFVFCTMWKKMRSRKQLLCLQKKLFCEISFIKRLASRVDLASIQVGFRGQVEVRIFFEHDDLTYANYSFRQTIKLIPEQAFVMSG
jgi:hypothetical protein